MKRIAVLVVAAGAFLAGSRLASGGPKYAGVPAELERRAKLLKGDLEKIRRAARDLNDIRAQIEEGFTYLNKTEREMQREGRKDFHIFMERARNDTLEVLALYDRVLSLRTYVDPMEKLFGDRFDDLVKVEWNDVGLGTILEAMSNAYGVPMVASPELDGMVTVSLVGEMTPQAILYYVESQFNARAVVKGKEIHFLPLEEKAGEGPEEED